ncbi:MAG TPA: Gfo/Idh/MocA family oxidoreductase, partial [Armatimonadota bacterium]|nr:Gfo/Idh/MocA family oxidoreductase [Armatimonadota bacterium]
PVTSVMCDMRILYPERPLPSGEFVPVEADDHVVMLARLANGATGTIEATKIATGTEDELRFEIHGDRGALRFNLMDLNYLEAYDLREPDSPMGGHRGWRKLATVQRYEKPSGFFPSSKSGIGWVRGHMHCLYSFLRAIATGEPAEPSLQRGIQIQRMLAAAAHSAATRTWQELPR